MENLKVQVTLPVETLDLLKRDAASFGFYWENKKQVNVNGFMNKLFANYVDAYLENRNSISDEIRNKFKHVLYYNEINDKTPNFINDLIHEMVLYTEERCFRITQEAKNTTRKDFYILKENVKLVKETKRKIDPHLSYSEFFRKLFVSYTSLPLDQRELIVFRSTAEKLLSAIQSRKKIRFSTDNWIFTASPISLKPTVIEPFNYLLCANKIKKNYYTSSSYRLSSIKNVEILDESNDLSQIQIASWQMRGKEYVSSISAYEKTIVKIHFSKKGEKRLKKTIDSFPSKIIHEDSKNRIYTFLLTPTECLEIQDIFRNNALIIEPITLAINAQEWLCKNSFL